MYFSVDTVLLGQEDAKFDSLINNINSYAEEVRDRSSASRSDGTLFI